MLYSILDPDRTATFCFVGAIASPYFPRDAELPCVPFGRGRQKRPPKGKNGIETVGWGTKVGFRFRV